jgi:hypothetical protein
LSYNHDAMSTKFTEQGIRVSVGGARVARQEAERPSRAEFLRMLDEAVVENAAILRALAR